MKDGKGTKDIVRRKEKKRGGVMCNGGWETVGALRDVGGTVAVALGAFGFVRAVDFFTKRLNVDQVSSLDLFSA